PERLQRVKADLQKADRREHFEEQLTNLQQVRDELSGELKTEQQATAQSRKRSTDLENRLRTNTAELERVKTDRDKHAQEHARLESDLRAQLTSAKAAAGQAQTALQEKVAQCSQFQDELAGLREARDELTAKLAAEQQAGAESRRRNDELASRLRENAAELQLVKANSEKQTVERVRLESELRAQLAVTKAAAEQAQAALKEEAARHKGSEQP